MALSENISKASKWSLTTELLSKLMAPITNMVLARLLTPESFGMVATITMVTSFADLFTEAGFQKYLVQADFSSREELDKHTNVAFWTNFCLSLIIWALIVLFRGSLANAVGNETLGKAIAFAAFSIPITSFSSIQISLYRRDFDFKTLFFARLVGIFIPIFVTVPLAIKIKNYWALIIGSLVIHLSNAIILTIRSTWCPSFFYSFDLLKKMINFSGWTFLEQLLGWANLNIGVFIVGKFLSDYYLGLYKTSMASVNQVMSIFVSALSPILLSSLSRLKHNKNDFQDTFYKFEENISIVVLPLGVGIFVFKELFTTLLLGAQWTEASDFIGLWSVVRAFFIVYGMFSMEVFVSLGYPRYSVISQLLTLVVLLPVLLAYSSKGFSSLCLARTLVCLWSITVDLCLLKWKAGISPFRIMMNTYPYLVISFLMGFIGFVMQLISRQLIWELFSVSVCIFFYFAVLMLIPKTRNTLHTVIKLLISH